MAELKINKSKLDKRLFSKIRQETKVISNITFILEKLDRDGHLNVLKQAFDSVFNNEIEFSIGELLKLQKRNKKLNMKSHLVNNTYIFKENLKSIMLFLGRLNS